MTNFKNLRFLAAGKVRAVRKGTPPFFFLRITRFIFVFLFLFLLSPALRVQSAPDLVPDVLRERRADAGIYAGMLDALKMSVEHYDGKRYTAALAALSGVGNAENTLFGEYILLYRAKACLELKRYKEAAEHFRILEKYFRGSPRLREAIMGRCRALLELNEPEQVKSLLEKYRQYTGAEPMYYNARALRLEGKKEESLALYMQIYAKYPSSSFSSPSYDNILKLFPNAFGGARNYQIRLERAENRVREKNYSAARTLLVALGQVSAPDGKAALRRNLLLAEAEYGLNRTSAALTVLGNLKTDDPDMRARALYLEGASRRRLKQETAFIALRDRALKLYPQSADTEELCYSVATYYDVNYEQRKARDAYKVLAQAFPKGKYAERAQWKAAFIAWFEGNYSIAAREFRDYIIANPAPASAGSGMYWLGRCYAKLGAAGEARYLYRRARALGGDGYYGLRAREAEEDLKSVLPGAGSSANPIDFEEIRTLCDGIQLPGAETIENPDANGIEIMRRAEYLAAAGLGNFAVAELRRGGEQYPENRRALSYMTAEISADRGNFYESISTLRSVFLNYNSLAWNDLPEEVWDLFYPTRYSDITAKYAKNAGLDLPLVLSLIRQESAFNPRARSSANARGLMQLLPSTARATAKSAGMTRVQADNLYNPEINIRLGTVYFAAMIKQHGRPELALGAYNAGGSRINRWIKEFGGDDMAAFVEQIPFAETRNYVKTVLGNAEHYRRLLAARGEVR